MHQQGQVGGCFFENLLKKPPGMDTVYCNWDLVLLCKPEMEGKKTFLVLYIGVFVCFVQPCLSYAEPVSGRFFLFYELSQVHKFNF